MKNRSKNKKNREAGWRSNYMSLKRASSTKKAKARKKLSGNRNKHSARDKAAYLASSGSGQSASINGTQSEKGAASRSTAHKTSSTAGNNIKTLSKRKRPANSKTLAEKQKNKNASGHTGVRS